MTPPPYDKLKSAENIRWVFMVLFRKNSTLFNNIICKKTFFFYYKRQIIFAKLLLNMNAAPVEISI